MHLKLRDQKVKSLIYTYETAISKPHGNHKPKIYSSYNTNKQKESKHNTKESHQITRGEKKRGKEQKRHTKTNKAIFK